MMASCGALHQPRRGRRLRYLASAFILAASACTQARTPLQEAADLDWELAVEGVAVQGMHVRDWNRSLRAKLVQPIGDPRSGETIYIELMNYSDAPIWFRSDYGPMPMLYAADFPWAIINSDLTDRQPGEVLMPRLSLRGDWSAQTSVHADMPAVNGEAVLRIVFVGLKASGTSPVGEPVGAYVDLPLPP